MLVARLVADEPLTLYEIGQSLGRKPGSVAGVVHRMAGDGVLLADPDPPVRGSQYRLNEAYLEALEEGLAERSPPGQIAEGRRTILAIAPKRLALYEVLARPAVAGSIDWIAEFDGAGTTLIMLAEGADALDADRLAIALESAGVDYRLGAFGKPMPAGVIRRFATTARRQSRDARGARAGR